MSDVTLIVMCAGNSTRFQTQAKKQWLRIDNEPLWLYVTKEISSYYDFSKIILTSNSDELSYMQNFSQDFLFVKGGESRQESMINALKHVKTKYVMITDVARACVPKEVILSLIQNKKKASCIVPILDISDTVIYNEETINRENVKLIQTPQLSNTAILIKALMSKKEFTDDSSAIKNINESVFYVKGSTFSKKITFISDMNEFTNFQAPCKNFFTGSGIDIHEFEENKALVLGGVTFDTSYGFKAHSDGDVLIHSIIDALLGAAGAGDIGEFFPDTSKEFKNADSKVLLEFIVKFIKNIGFELVNIDLTIIAQKPKINPRKLDIKFSLAKILQIPAQFINIKATTAEKMGFIGREEGIAVQSIATLKYFDWKNI